MINSNIKAAIEYWENMGQPDLEMIPSCGNHWCEDPAGDLVTCIEGTEYTEDEYEKLRVGYRECTVIVAGQNNNYTLTYRNGEPIGHSNAYPQMEYMLYSDYPIFSDYESANRCRYLVMAADNA